MGMSIGELFVSLGFDVDSGKLESFTDSIKAASTEVLKLSAIATSGVVALGAFMEGSVNRAMNYKNFTTETGQAAEGLQRFQSVVNQVNSSISTEEAAVKYRALANAMTDITQQGGGGAIARLTGGAFHIGMTEDQVIEAIHAYKQQFIAQNANGAAVHARLLDQVGLGAGTERAFDLTPQQYKAASDPFIRSQNGTDNLMKFGTALAILQQQWDKFKDDLAGDWAVPLINAIRVAEDWLKDFLKSVEAIYKVWVTWPTAIKDASEVLLAVLALWVVPFGGTLAVVTAIAAAIWDIGRAIRGLPSVTGTVLDAEGKGLKMLWNDPGKFFSNIGDALRDDKHADMADRQFRQQWVDAANERAKHRVEHILPPAGAGGNNVTQNVTAHINSTAPAQALVDEFMRRNQTMLNQTLMSFAGNPVQ